MGLKPLREGISQPSCPLYFQPFCDWTSHSKVTQPCDVSQHILEGFLEYPVLGQELDMMILVGPFLPRVFSDSVLMT